MRKITSFLFIFISITVIAQKGELTLNDAVMQQWRKYYPKNTPMVKWIPNTTAYTYVSSDYQKLMKADAKKGGEETICTVGELNEWTGAKFGWMNVQSWKDQNSFYTSTGGEYFLIDLANKKARLLAKLPKEGENGAICPANDHLAYTSGNSLFVLDNMNNGAQVDEGADQVVTGQAIARSEFGISGGVFWSNTGKYLGFYQKDESAVADYPLLDITTPTGSLKSIKYPMAGQPSEKGRAGAYNIETGKSVIIKPTGNEEDYVTNFAWGPKDKYFYVIEVNRGQNHSKLQKYNAETGTLEATLIEEKNDKWVEPEFPVYFVDDQQFIYMSEKDGFMNMYLYKDDGTFVKQLTNNKWVIKEIVGHDAAGNIFFKGTGENPTQSHYYKVNVKTGKQTKLTEGGTNSASFSSDFKYFFNGMSSHDVPNVEVIRDANGKKVSDVLKADNPYENTVIGSAEIGTIKSADGQTDLYYRLIKPSDFDASKKYPVLVYVYGGPHAQLITDSWLDGASLWMYWMAEQGYLVYTVDGRGSGNRGFAFENVIHRQLGTNEMDDQLKGVEHLKSMPFVDGDRIAVHGWSFGGFMTTSLMLRHPGVYTCGVAGGPVTDWSYYEVMYGERYMDTPEENPDGYKTARLMEYVDKLQGDLLLIHGTVDDVVVMQHNLALVKAFVDAGVQMDFFPYPMHPHNVGGRDRVHLMEKVLTYVIENNQ